MQFLAVSVTDEVEEFIQGSDAIELQKRLDEALQGLDGDSGITSVSLAAGGDGHSFVVRIGRVLSEPVGSLTAVRLAVYEAGSSEGLPGARQNALNFLNNPAATLRAEELAGASQGTKQMGLIVTGSLVAP